VQNGNYHAVTSCFKVIYGRLW